MTGQRASETGSLAVVVAHPDDDSYGIAGTVALHAEDPGFRFVLVHATIGENGDIAPGFPATRATLGRLRRDECERSWRAVGRPPDRHDWLGYPDGRVADVSFAELVERIEQILEEERPDVVCTFGPDGVTGHPDHITVGRATDEAFRRARASRRRPGPGLHRLLHGALCESTLGRWNATRVREGLHPWDPGTVYHLRGVPDDCIGVEVDTSSVSDRVLAGLLEHRSQRHVIFDPNRSDEQWRRAVGRETLVQIWPPRASGAPVLRDVFEGLDAVRASAGGTAGRDGVRIEREAATRS